MCLSCALTRSDVYEPLWHTAGQDGASGLAKPISPPPAPPKTYKIEDFVLLKVLGKGSFGKVSTESLISFSKDLVIGMKYL